MDIIMSIHPKWAEKIYKGEKTMEWRKTDPKNADSLSTIFIYETAPICRVTGCMRLNKVIAYDFVGRIFAIPKYLIDCGCVSPMDLKKYQGKSDYVYGWHIYNPTKFNEPVMLESLDLKRPPQSWQYLKEEK